MKQGIQINDLVVFTHFGKFQAGKVTGFETRNGIKKAVIEPEPHQQFTGAIIVTTKVWKVKQVTKMANMIWYYTEKPFGTYPSGDPKTAFTIHF